MNHRNDSVDLRPFGFALTALLACTFAAAQHVEDYPMSEGGAWVRGPNIVDEDGEPYPRQEHAVANLNGFIYGFNGVVPVEPAEPTEDEPDPAEADWGRASTVFVPAGHPNAAALAERAAGGEGENEHGFFVHLDGEALHPTDNHHLIYTVHEGSFWTFGGHIHDFLPSDVVAVFSPDSPDAPDGSWSGIRIEDGEPCDLPELTHDEDDEHPGDEAIPDECLRLPEPRAAGFAVSHEGSIYVLGGVVDNENPRDPENEAIRADNRVYRLDTGQFPLEWEEMPAMNEAREHFTAVVVGERVYALRGRTDADTAMRAVESWAPGEASWTPEQNAPVGGSAGIVAATGECIYVFGGEFTPLTDTGTLTVSQVFHVPSATWSTLESDIAEEPLDASDVLHLHGVYAATFEHEGQEHIFVMGGGDEAWASPISKTHVFTPPADCAAAAQ